MKDYQSKSYTLPHDVYMQTLWFIRGYDRRRTEAEAILFRSSDEDRRKKLLSENKIIDKALEVVPEEYRAAILSNVCYRIPYPLCVADRTTYSRWRVRFITEVAEGLGI